MPSVTFTNEDVLLKMRESNPYSHIKKEEREKWDKLSSGMTVGAYLSIGGRLDDIRLWLMLGYINFRYTFGSGDFYKIRYVKSSTD